MDKRLILSVAGSGKTTYILSKLCLEKRHLLITFTNNNYNNLRLGVIKKFGYIPENVKIYTYFSFLYNFAYKPFLASKLKEKGITWDLPKRDFSLKTSIEHYINRNGYIYGNRMAKLIIARNLGGLLNARIEKYFDNLYIDEVQDFAGSDFNFLKVIIQSNLNILLVGDFFQHTYDTSHDGNINSTLHQSIQSYISNFSRAKFPIDTKTLSKSYRCNITICNYISHNLGIPIESHKTSTSEIIFISDPEEAIALFHDNATVKLFYQSHNKYPCFSENWGASKGNDHYESVCVVLNPKTYTLLLAGRAQELSPTTRNKLYVAISRSKERLYFVEEALIKSFKIR